MVFPPKRVTGASATDTGSSTQVGGADNNIYYDYFANVDTTGPATINTSTNYRSGKLGVSNPANTFNYKFVGSAITTADKNVTLPLLTSSDTFAFESFAQTLSNKTLASSCDISAITAAVLTTRASTYGDFNQIFRSGRVRITDPANTIKYIIHGSNGPVGDVDISIPPVASADTIVMEDQSQNIDNKTLGSGCDISGIANAVLTDRENTYSTSVNQRFASGRLHVVSPALDAEYWIHGQGIAADLDLLLPLITDTDTLVANNCEATLSNKVLDNTCDVSDAIGASSGTVATQSGATNDINTTNAEQNMLNYTVTGGSMCVNGSVEFKITGYILANSGSPTYTFKIKFGGTTMYQGVTAAFGASATKIPFRIEGEIFNKNATNAQGASAMILINDTTATTTGIGDIGSAGTVESVFDSEGADTTKDTTTDQVLLVTVTMSVNNSAVHTVVKHTKVEVFQNS